MVADAEELLSHMPRQPIPQVKPELLADKYASFYDAAQEWLRRVDVDVQKELENSSSKSAKLRVKVFLNRLLGLELVSQEHVMTSAPSRPTCHFNPSLLLVWAWCASAEAGGAVHVLQHHRQLAAPHGSQGGHARRRHPGDEG